jgi:hypothetical protein
MESGYGEMVPAHQGDFSSFPNRILIPNSNFKHKVNAQIKETSMNAINLYIYLGKCFHICNTLIIYFYESSNLVA